MKKQRVRLILNIVIAAVVFAAWAYMMARSGGMLTARGLRSLRYFTVLSNLLEGIASIVLAVALLRGKDSGRISLLRLVAASAVSLTFLVVVLFLGPLFGYPMMFRGANLWMHLIVPLAAIAEYVFFNDFEVPKPKRRWVVVSPLAYGTVYLINVLVNGAPGNDIYGFTMWGLPVAAVIFVVICAATFLTGVLLSKGNEKAAGGNLRPWDNGKPETAEKQENA